MAAPKAALQPPNTGSQRAVARAHPVAESVPGRIAGLSVGQVIGWQVAVAAVLVTAVRRDWTLVPAVAFALVVLALTVVRRRGRWLYQNVAVRMRYRARRRVRPADGPVDPRLATLRELVPALDVSGITLRSGERIGVAYDGWSWVGVVAVHPVEDVVPRPQQAPWLPVRSLVEALTVDDIALAGVQVLRYTVPAPAGVLPAQSPVAGSYTQLNMRRTPASQHLWIALRLDPAGCPGGRWTRRRCVRCSRWPAGCARCPRRRAPGVPTRRGRTGRATAPCTSRGGSGPGRRGASRCRRWPTPSPP